MQSFQDHGYQILGQAHMMSLIAQGYSQNTNVSSGLSSARPLPAWAIEPTSRAIGDQRTAGQLDVVQSATMIPRQLQPQTQWPFQMDPSLPAEGWWQVNGVFVHLPQQLQTELDDSLNKSVMMHSHEVPWKQNPTFYVLSEFSDLRLYDSKGPLTISDDDHFDWSRLVPIFLRLKKLLVLAYGRCRSVSELSLRTYELGTSDKQVLDFALQYMKSLLHNPENLSVPAKHWQTLAEIMLMADQIHVLEGMSLTKLRSGAVALVAKLNLDHAVSKPASFGKRNTIYHIAHNTSIDSAAHIIRSGIFRPSKFQTQDITWMPGFTFYCRGHNSEITIAWSQASQYVSPSRPVCVLGVASLRQIGHVRPKSGGTHTDLVAGVFYDALRSKDGRWAFKSSVSKPIGLAIWHWPQ